jgi:hypothetical protein
MLKGTLHLWNSFRSKKAAKQFEDSIEDLLKVGQRHAVQFAKLAALARTIRDSDLSHIDGVMLVAVLEEIADRAELEATFDTEAFEMLAHELRRERLSKPAVQHEQDDPSQGGFVGQSTAMKH